MSPSRSLCCLTALAFLAVPLFAQEGDKPATKERAENPVHDQMESAEEAIDVVVDYVKKFEGEAPLEALDTALKALQEAKQHPPRTALQQPEDKRAEFIKAYRVELNKSIRLMLDLEDAIVAKDQAGAKKALAALGEHQKASHRVYKPKRQRRSRGGAGKD